MEIEAIVESARTEMATAEPSAPVRVDLATGSQPIDVPSGATPTVALSPVEITAIIQGTGPAAATAGAHTRPTTANVRLAMGSASLPATAAPAGQARGPRRARETLRADRIRAELPILAAPLAPAARAPTSTAQPPAPTSTAQPPAPTATAQPPAPTATGRPPALTSTTAPSPGPKATDEPPPPRPPRRTLPWRKR